MHHRGGEITIRGSQRGLIGAQQPLGNRKNDVVHPCIHVIFEENFFCAFGLMHLGVIRQIVRDGLVAMAQITGPVRGIHYFHRRHVTLLRRSVLRRKRQSILNRRHVLLEDVQLAAFGVIADQYSGSVGRLHAEQSVQVTLVLKVIEGGIIAGTITGLSTVDPDIRDGRLSGDDLSFFVNIDHDGETVRMVFAGRVSGEEMQLDMKMDTGWTGHLTVKRS